MIHMFFADSVNCGHTVVDCSSLPRPAATPDVLHTVLNIVFAVTASIALLMIVIAGFRYVLANGDPNDMAQARNAIIYALVGLIVTMAAYGIVTFVVYRIA